ncbi:hypothetical protein EVAR_74757_1 [Eumeta japonica]|uniref:Uncharacterized protein n=1 Tax=Eumeta variegata TaxID=151549 RepID=A0A4C1SSD8_EUMVA|nr:hypothetical protein EVAR_74757_1 [Eumeta japonica]
MRASERHAFHSGMVSPPKSERDRHKNPDPVLDLDPGPALDRRSPLEIAAAFLITAKSWDILPTCRYSEHLVFAASVLPIMDHGGSAGLLDRRRGLPGNLIQNTARQSYKTLTFNRGSARVDIKSFIICIDLSFCSPR